MKITPFFSPFLGVGINFKNDITRNRNPNKDYFMKGGMIEMGLNGISIILIICYLIGEVIKKFSKEKINNYIPLILMLLGGILGILIYVTNKELMIGVCNIYEALIIGLIGGSGSTGTNQIIKQLLKIKEEKQNERNS